MQAQVLIDEPDEALTGLTGYLGDVLQQVRYSWVGFDTAGKPLVETGLLSSWDFSLTVQKN